MEEPGWQPRAQRCILGPRGLAAEAPGGWGLPWGEESHLRGPISWPGHFLGAQDAQVPRSPAWGGSLSALSFLAFPVFPVL